MTTTANEKRLSTDYDREQNLVALLRHYLVAGLIFLILPGTFLGVWNLFVISGARSATQISPSWIQAHGHAQLFGWIGTFILGIGFYSIPNLRSVSNWSFLDGRLILALWTTGVSLRWLANVYLLQWQSLLPISALLEMVAVLLFSLRLIQGHRMRWTSKRVVEPWAALVIMGVIGFLLTVVMNAAGSILILASGKSPAFPSDIDNYFLIVSIWGFTLPVVWGFTARWMPIILGLKSTRPRFVYFAMLTTVAGISASAVSMLAGSMILLVAAALVTFSLRILERSDSPGKLQGVHASFPVFMRIAYLWLLVAATIGVWSAVEPESLGIKGASRHAVTVGFLMTMVFSVAPRMLPAFLRIKKLFSQRLMLFALLLTNSGCLLRVCSEMIAYRDPASWIWAVLPISATLELSGILVFAANMIATFRGERYACTCAAPSKTSGSGGSLTYGTQNKGDL